MSPPLVPTLMINGKDLEPDEPVSRSGRLYLAQFTAQGNTAAITASNSPQNTSQAPAAMTLGLDSPPPTSRHTAVITTSNEVALANFRQTSSTATDIRSGLSRSRRTAAVDSGTRPEAAISAQLESTTPAMIHEQNERTVSSSPTFSLSQAHNKN
ncbi:MAG: hypothetical protein M1814_001282 [Vezdaea aestivalis]|nr:MAG: hypothetical protein M1814_001282 [Vezdaea aestivalis]